MENYIVYETIAAFVACNLGEKPNHLLSDEGHILINLS